MEDIDRTANSGQIVVGVDGSAGSKAALAWAARQARRDGKSLVAVYCWEPTMIGLAPYIIDAVDPSIDAAKVLQETIDEVLGPDRGVDIEPLTVPGSPGRTLTRIARGAALLVVGRHGRHEWSGYLGSTSLYCARRATPPVVVVHH
jgi:nucleotide-binding universal stress UspA family protein